jgi:hypothetical protein
MTEKEIIDEVLNALKVDFEATHEVALFPDKPEPNGYVLQHPNGAILVSGADVSSMQPNIRQQADMLGIEVTLYIKSLNAPTGIYETSDSIRSTLSGLWIGGMFHFYQVTRSNPEYDFENEYWVRGLMFMSPQIYKMGED